MSSYVRRGQGSGSGSRDRNTNATLLARVHLTLRCWPLLPRSSPPARLAPHPRPWSLAPRPFSILQLEQPRQRIEQHVRDAVAGFVAERFQRRVQQLIQQPLEGAADLLAGLFVQLRQFVQQPP